MDEQKVIINSLFITVRNRQKIVFDDEARALTSVNAKGLFDILPQHENFVCLVKDRIVIRKKNGQEEEVKLVRGILKAYKNNVHVFIV